MSAAPSTVEEGRAALDAAGERQRKIDQLIAEEQAKLDVMKQARADKGRGRPNTANASRFKALEAKIARLQRGLLPGELAPPTPATPAELRASAAQHPQHHAAASNAPPGRLPAAAASSSRDNGDGRDVQPNDDGDDDDGEIGEQNPEFKQYYAVSDAQKAYNAEIGHAYLRGQVLRSEFKFSPTICWPAAANLS